MELCHIPSLYIHRSYVTPVELGRAWLRREVLRSAAIDLERTRWRVIRESIDEALVVEWQRRWHSANTGGTLFALLDRAGEPWMPEDASELLRTDGAGPCCTLYDGSLSSWPL